MKSFLKKSMISTFIALIVISFSFTNITVNAKTSESEAYEIKVSYGIQGKYRAMKYIPVTVEVNSLERDFIGEIEVRVASSNMGTYDAYSKEVSLTKGEISKVTIPVKVLENSSKMTVNIVEDGKVLSQKKTLISNGRVTETNLFTGVLTDDATSLGYIGNVKFDSSRGFEGTIENVYLDENIIGENNLNIDGLDAIIINNYNMSNLKKEQYDAINSWINKGGTLILGAGANESKTIGSIDKDFLQVKSNGVKEENLTLVEDNLKLITSNLEVKDAKIKNGTSEKPLVYSIEKGRGEILITTFDLGLEPLISSKDASKFLSLILTDAANGIFDKNMNGGYMGQGYYRARELMQSIPINEIVGTKSLIVVFGLYALIIGVVLYIVLKKLNKRDLTWIAIPAISIVFALVIYFMGSSTRVNDVILNQNNIVSVDKDGKGLAKGYIGIGTKYKEDVIIEKPEDVTMNYITQDTHYYGNPEEEIKDRLRVKTTYKGNNSYFTFADSDALDMKTFEVIGKEQVIPKIDSNFNLSDGNLNGAVKNNLDKNINKLILVAGQNVWDLGELPKGEEKAIEGAATSGGAGLQAYSDTLNQKYYDARWNDKEKLKTEEYKNILRTSSLLASVSDELYINKEIKLIAITDLSIEYGIDFGKKSISKFDTTAIIQDVDIDFKSKDGTLNFPDGFFSYKVDSVNSSSNVHLDEYSGYIYGQGDIIFDYKIDDNIAVTEVIVKSGVDRYGYNGGENGEKFIYNYKTSDYEKITLSQGFEKIKDIENYIENNTMKIKVTVDEMKGQSMVPRITVKGREK
ncbi:hypothetical protein PMY56_00100 [Clostridium tertium]|jgi:hypothetical protein|uniref:hypothetical protein n=1 Tax=Clostridium TaxID=1485 RepID=UPI00189FDD67|nr:MULTISPECIES: hypothetical protein [Clostridium]MBS5307890.1 hypothetical protein [Clostridium sp.]MDB1921290.1 hypothetical protein [Clostridium tertium]MDB1924535.1 hypothetical protein [Clostridium tertium]MDB1928065.1 hypothetical protein [Clostridium tertium]MDB1945376.1 hypothetical protein [Clostridium tertium]